MIVVGDRPATRSDILMNIPKYSPEDLASLPLLFKEFWLWKRKVWEGFDAPLETPVYWELGKQYCKLSLSKVGTDDRLRRAPLQQTLIYKLGRFYCRDSLITCRLSRLSIIVVCNNGRRLKMVDDLKHRIFQWSLTESWMTRLIKAENHLLSRMKDFPMVLTITV